MIFSNRNLLFNDYNDELKPSSKIINNKLSKKRIQIIFNPIRRIE